MDISQFHYDLPDSLIAQRPLAVRTDSRLLVLDGADGAVTDLAFECLVDLLSEGDLLVFNDTRVIPARFHALKETGGKVEILVERLLDEFRILAQLRASKRPRAGQAMFVTDAGQQVVWRVEQDQGQFWVLRADRRVIDVLEHFGHTPLPPYIARPAEPDDIYRYQTVYAAVPGAVAAPTAGLHFSAAYLDRLRERGISLAYVTLHVGAGTFQPVREQDITRHRLHSEWLCVSRQLCDAVSAARSRGGRVGTTAVRALETAAGNGGVRPYTGETDLFLYPGRAFRVVDAMLTNFHLPRSSLLMLVCAFAGTEHTLAAYRHAVRRGYRFFSYGDAMFVTPGSAARRR